jgi:hypothetical protein
LYFLDENGNDFFAAYYQKSANNNNFMNAGDEKYELRIREKRSRVRDLFSKIEVQNKPGLSEKQLVLK